MLPYCIRELKPQYMYKLKTITKVYVALFLNYIFILYYLSYQLGVSTIKPLNEGDPFNLIAL